ncbi:MAG: hypothetical protein E6K66_05005 [Nitrospirae bacterium]|nr:MAG: hypothetical protein E6K66_05005 [Nitrospirota bacterium]
MIVCIVGIANFVQAADNKTKEPAGVVDQVGTALKNTATKIEQQVSGVVKKLEESETPKKVGNELKRSAESLGQKVEEAGKKLKESFKSEK